MTLRWGICGAGKISHDFVIGVKTVPNSEHQLVAVAARSADCASDFAASHGIKRSYGSYIDLAKDVEIDVVYVGTIHTTHANIVKMFMDEGKHVLCEKPLTMNARDTASLIKKASNGSVFLMEALWTRFFPAVVELKRQISAGRIGDVKFVQASFGFKRNDTSGKTRLDDPSQGGGGVLDVGVYPISFATMIFGEKPESVHASGWLTASGVDEFAAITLKYGGERVAQLSCSIGVDLVNEAVVTGTTGKLKLEAPFWCPTKLKTSEGVLEYPLPTGVLPVNFTNSEGLGYEAEEVRRCIQTGKLQSDTMPLEHSQIAADIMDSVMKQLGVVYFNHSE